MQRIEEVLLIMPDDIVSRLLEKTRLVEIWAGTKGSMTKCQPTTTEQGKSSVRAKCNAQGTAIDIAKGDSEVLKVCQVVVYDQPRQSINTSQIYYVDGDSQSF